MPIFVNDGKSPLQSSGAADVTPTPNSWAANTEVLAGDKVLTDSSETIQYLDPDGLIPFVDVPSATGDTPFFFIANIGTQGGILRIRSGAVVVHTLENSQAIRVWGDGTDLLIDESVSVNFGSVVGTGGTLFYWGGSGWSNNEYGRNNEHETAATSTGSNADTEQYIPAAGTVATTVGYSKTGGGGDLTFEIYKNGGATGATFSIAAADPDVGTKTLSGPAVSVVAGDFLTMRCVASTAGSERHVWILIPSQGFNFTWGAQWTSSSAHPATNGDSDALQTTTTWQHEQVVPMLAKAIRYTRAGNADTNIGILKNGALSETVTTSTDDVSEPINTIYFPGDRCSIDRQSDTLPDDSNHHISFDIAAMCYSFGGNADLNGDRFEYLGEATTSIGSGATSIQDAVTLAPGKITHISWHVENASPGDEFGIYVNDVLVHTAALDGNDIGYEELTTPVVVALADRINVVMDTGFTDESIVNVFVS